MAFLDNSGDIILDAVLTDTGRYKLAKGDGSFRIAKFALGDDEIDYSLYDNAQDSARVDLEILSTPILEAFTDNAVALKSKLMSIPRNELLFLPILKLFETGASKRASVNDAKVFCVCADEETQKEFAGNETGILPSTQTAENFSAEIVVDQGLDTTAIAATQRIDSDLRETQYIIEIDSRLGTIISSDGSDIDVSYVDDDKIASYYLSTTNSNFIENITSQDNGASSISGPRGTRLKFKLKPSMGLQYSDFLFQQLGNNIEMNINSSGNKDLNYIDTNVRITGATTGYRLDLPVRFLKI